MKFHVTLDFKRGPSFSYEVDAASQQEAINKAQNDAVAYGFDEPVKKSKAIAAAD